MINNELEKITKILLQCANSPGVLLATRENSVNHHSPTYLMTLLACHPSINEPA